MAMQYNPEIEKLQIALGMTAKDVDGKRGDKTNAAILAAADAGRLLVSSPAAVTPTPAPTVSTPHAVLGSASVAKLNGVHPALRGVILAAAERSRQPFAVIEGLRTKERQAQLVKSGASKTMNSRHITGHAVDLWPLDAYGRSLPSDAAFKRGSAEAKAADRALWAGLRSIAEIVKAVADERGIAIEWGGDWSSFPDGPHFQLTHKGYPT